MRISDWSSDLCSSDLPSAPPPAPRPIRSPPRSTPGSSACPPPPAAPLPAPPAAPASPHHISSPASNPTPVHFELTNLRSCRTNKPPFVSSPSTARLRQALRTGQGRETTEPEPPSPNPQNRPLLLRRQKVRPPDPLPARSEDTTSELQSLM